MAHVTYVLSLDATQPPVADPTRRPQATHVLDLRLPNAGFAGHIIGRGGHFIKPLLERWPLVRVHIDCDTVSVIGPLAADVLGRRRQVARQGADATERLTRNQSERE
jgi:hypothetical protein